jgi:hypothetical protein
MVLLTERQPGETVDKSKIIPVEVQTDADGCRTLRRPGFSDSRLMKVARLSALAPAAFTPYRPSPSPMEVDSRAIVGPEVLRE